MITIGKANFDFEAENQPFIQFLYGDWDHFFRVSFENVVEDVLKCYDNQEELIRVESLTVDMGTLTEEEFREQFPRILARKLADIFSAYLLNKEAHPEEISVISISRSHIEKISFYLLHGYIRSDEEGGAWNFSQVMQQVLQSDRAALCLFLQVNGGKVSLRERLVFQLSDDVLEMLAVAVLPSDGNFVIPYIRFLIASHKSLKRPEVRVGDYRNIVWMVVWGYLFSESKGYFSRKKLVAYTLQHLSAHYNIEYNTLLNLLTIGLKEYVSSLLVIPELLAILSEIRSELSDGNCLESVYRSLSGDELIRRLSVPESCRSILSPLSEQAIYELVVLVIPVESDFIIRYAQALDEEKSRGMLEGKAGTEFRILKWEFIFLMLLSVPVSRFNRKQFVHSVLQRLAGHYNLTVTSLILYFYKGLLTNDITMSLEISQLLVSLYEDLETTPVESLLSADVETEKMRFRLADFLITGEVEEGRVDELASFVRSKMQSDPEWLLDVIRQMERGGDSVLQTHTPEVARLFASLLFLVIRSYGLCFVQSDRLMRLLENIRENRTMGNAAALRKMLYYCITNRMDQFLNALNSVLQPVQPLLPEIETKDSFVKPDNPVVTEERARTYIHNAGLVILVPYFPRLFTMLELMDVPACLKDRDAMVKGIFSLQYLVYDDREFPEYELLLNKLLTGYEMNKPLPRFLPLEANECEILLSLLKGVMQNWKKMKNTSTEGFRSSFLQRNGVLEEFNDRWLLTVEQRAFDVLLDSIPWSYTPVKYTWMKKPLYVKWRD